MNRRDFLRRHAAATLGATAFGAALPDALTATAAPARRSERLARGRSGGKVLNAYYFRAHMYTCVPRHVRHDMETMAEWGTTHVTIAVLEQD
ncbi:MAG: hypothetical protein AAFV01_07535, partial [Bacteroidota bacterium]